MTPQDEILPFEISPLQVKDLLERGAEVHVLDVREPAEYAICRVEGSRPMPMQTVPGNLAELERDDRLQIVICHHGVRSLSVVDWLRRQGVENCQSMAGGMDRWSREVDSAVPRY